MLEKKIEQTVKDYARSKGFLAYKWVSPNHVGVPDAIFIAPNGKVFFVEFKREGAKATAMQLREHERMRANNAEVYLIDSIESGKQLIDFYASTFRLT
jgi:hypothetical protein